MNEVRKKAFELRVQGYSYNEINRSLGIPKSTLSGWFKDLELSPEANKRLDKRKRIGTEVLIKRNIKQTELAWDKASKIQSENAKQIKSLSKRDLLILGSGLYWAEGYKKLRVKNGIERTGHQISFVNSDPLMIKVFIKFLIEILSTNPQKIVLVMRIYEGMDEKKCCRYWKKVTGLTTKNFRKSTYLVSISSQRKRPFNRLPFGTLAVQVFNTEKFNELIGFINGLKYDIN